MKVAIIAIKKITFILIEIHFTFRVYNIKGLFLMKL